MNCPTCNTELLGLARYCHVCEEHLEFMEVSTTDVSPEARDRLEGGDAHAGDERALDMSEGELAETEQPLPIDQRRRVATSAAGHRSAGSPTLKDGRP